MISSFKLLWISHKEFCLRPRIQRSFHNCTIKSIITGSIWFVNLLVCELHSFDHKNFQTAVGTAQHITGGELPPLKNIYASWCLRLAFRIIEDTSHHNHSLFTLQADTTSVLGCTQVDSEAVSSNKHIKLLNNCTLC